MVKSPFRRILAFCLCLAVFISIGAGSCFALREEFISTSGFLVKVCVYIEFYYPNGAYGGYATSRGTGLLVGSDGEMRGVVTNASVVGGEHLTTFADEIAKEHGFAGYNVGVPQVIPDGNDAVFGVSGNVIIEDENCDLAVLELASPIYVDEELKVRSNLSLIEGEQVFSVCFAETVNNVYELSVEEGYVNSFDNERSEGVTYQFIDHTAPISETAQGGFLLDGEGALIGLITDKASMCAFEGVSAVSAFTIINYYLLPMGYDNATLVGAPENVVIGTLEDIPAQNGTAIFGDGVIGRFISELLSELGFDLRYDFENDISPRRFFGVLFFILLILVIIVSAVCILGLFFLSVVLASVIIVFFAVKKKRSAAVEQKTEDSAVLSQDTDQTL